MISIAWRNLWRNKHRSILTLIGIVIGVASIVTLVSISIGLGEKSADVMNSFQGIYVLEYGAADIPFSHISADYCSKLEAIPGVKFATPEIWGNIPGIDGLDEGSTMFSKFIFLVGIDPEKSKGYPIAPYYTVTEGRELTPNDRRAVVIGEGLKDEFNLVVGNTIRIDGKSYQIVGTFDSESQLFNYMVISTIDSARDLLGFDKDTVSTFQVVPNNPKDVASLKNRIDARFDGKLQALSMQDSAELITGFLGNLTIALWFVSGIAGIVGGIGVMNTMLMSVMERIQEFGVLKAIGWRDRDVMIMVLLESIMLSVIGGIIGVSFGYAISATISNRLGMPSSVDITLISQALFFALVMGFVGGAYPSYKSIKMSPVEAVRG